MKKTPLTILAVMVSIPMLFGCSSALFGPSNDIDQFCKLALDNSAKEINFAEDDTEEAVKEALNKLDKIRAVAPDELKEDITTLHEGIRSISDATKTSEDNFTALASLGDELDKMQEAGKHLDTYVNEHCRK